MKQISKDRAEKIILRRELYQKILERLIWLPIAGLVWLSYSIVASVYPLLRSKVFPELSKELLTKLLTASTLLNLILLALCILLIFQLRKKPIREEIDLRDHTLFKI